MRFFVNNTDISGDTAILGEDNLRHLRALRVRPGEEFIVCDGAGTDYVCTLSEQHGGSPAKIIRTQPSPCEPDIDCTVFLAMAKGDKLDFAVQKSVELGACGFVLFPSARCVATPGTNSAAKKIVRLQRIALEAAMQSGRGVVPPVSAAESFEAAVTAASAAGLPLFFYEREKSLSFKDALTARAEPKTVSIVTGPEGGFEDYEAAFAQSRGMLSVTLGVRILRCETAPVCAISAIMFFTGNLS